MAELLDQVEEVDRSLIVALQAVAAVTKRPCRVNWEDRAILVGEDEVVMAEKNGVPGGLEEWKDPSLAERVRAWVEDREKARLAQHGSGGLQWQEDEETAEEERVLAGSGACHRTKDWENWHPMKLFGRLFLLHHPLLCVFRPGLGLLGHQQVAMDAIHLIGAAALACAFFLAGANGVGSVDCEDPEYVGKGVGYGIGVWIAAYAVAGLWIFMLQTNCVWGPPQSEIKSKNGLM